MTVDITSRRPALSVCYGGIFHALNSMKNISYARDIFMAFESCYLQLRQSPNAKYGKCSFRQS